MSCPAFAWALDRGAALDLLPADRLVLIYLADMANGEMVCWPGQPTIERFTGLANNTIRASIHRLEAMQLLRVEAASGKVTRYHILRPPTPANGGGVAAHTPANGPGVTPANHTGAPPQNVGAHPRKREAEPPNDLRLTPANGGGDPSKIQEDPSARARARGKEGFQDPEAEASKQADPAPAATPGGDTFNSYLDAPAPTKALPCEVDQEVVRADVPDPDGPPPPWAFKALIDSIASGFQNNYPPRATDLSRSEMIDLCQDKPRIRPAYLPDAVLRLQRQQLAEQAAHRA